MLLTRSPLPLRGARLACMRHAINVRSEPGSNSPLILYNLWSETSGWQPVWFALEASSRLLLPLRDAFLLTSLLMTGHRLQVAKLSLLRTLTQSSRSAVIYCLFLILLSKSIRGSKAVGFTLFISAWRIRYFDSETPSTSTRQLFFFSS